jgi:hypothetical protein
MMEDNIVKRSTKLKHPNYVDFSLTENAKIMRKLNILGISKESMTFTMVYEKILLSLSFSLRTNILSKSKLDKVLSQAKVDDLFTRNENNRHGMSIDDFIKQSDSYYGRDAIEKAFTFLEQINIIKKTFFDNDIKYRLADEKLQKLLDAIGHAFIEELYLLTYKWRHFSQPTKEEKDRLEWIFNMDACRRIIQSAEIARYENKKARETSKNIAEYIEYLKLGNIDEFELSLITYAFKLYNNNKRKNLARVRSPKKHIQGYFNLLEQRFKQIELDFVNKIENIRKGYRETIQKYAFIFQYILNHICPLILKEFGSFTFKSLNSFEQKRRAKLMEMVYTASLNRKLAT